jgi:hypothetical protein
MIRRVIPEARSTPRTKEGTHVGALITLDLPADSPQLGLPWIITFGPLDDGDDWEPVVCGPYERAHALAIAETVVADEDLTAVVEPVLPHASVDEIRAAIESAQTTAEVEDEESFADDALSDDLEVSVDDEYDEDEEFDDEEEELEFEEVEPTPPPSPAEVRAGFARIAARLTESV